jgi:hypothetical protein
LLPLQPQKFVERTVLKTNRELTAQKEGIARQIATTEVYHAPAFH